MMLVETGEMVREWLLIGGAVFVVAAVAVGFILVKRRKNNDEE